MLSQSFNRSTAIRRNSFGYFPTRLFATCSSFPCKCALSECLKLRVQSIKLKHGRKHLLLVVAVFSILTLASFRFSQHTLFFRPLVQVVVIIVPLLAIYYSSRRFEYAADAEAVDFTGEPETAIRALTNLHRIHEVPARADRFTELFMTHPSLTQRIEAIAKAGQIPAERLKLILDDAGVA